MADDALDVEEVEVGGSPRIRERIPGVEDVEPLVLHRAHVVEVDADNLVELEIVLEAEAVLIPLHGLLEARDGMEAAVMIADVDIELKVDVLSRLRGEGVAHNVELACDQGIEVAGHGHRHLADHIVASAGELAALLPVAVHQKVGILRLISLDAARKFAADVRAVKEVGDVPESLRLVLRAEMPLGHIEALERGVALRGDVVDDLEGEVIRNVPDGKAHVICRIVSGAAVDEHGLKPQVLAVKHQILSAAGAALHMGYLLYPGILRIKLKIEAALRNGELGSPVVKTVLCLFKLIDGHIFLFFQLT